MGEGQMKVAAHTNVRIRAAVQDDLQQARRAAKILAEAISLRCRCWFCVKLCVLRRGYRKSAIDVSDAIRRLRRSPNVEMNRTAEEAGLSTLDAGGDSADGVIAHEWEWPVQKNFVSFDSRAISSLQAQGSCARLLS